MAADITTTLEPELIERARGGDRAAFLELYRREAPSAWRLAVAVTRGPAPAAAAVAAGFAKVLAGPAPTPADLRGTLRARLLAATREAALGDDAPAAAPLHTVATPAASLTLQAFNDLPERWRSVLWLTEGEGHDIADVAAALRMTPDATDELAGRARAGLRERFAAAHLAAAGTLECERIATRLDGYATEELSIREANRVRRHLDGCDACRDRLAELDDLTPRLRHSALPVPVTLAAQVERTWQAATVVESGPLHITLPSGRKVPAWAERAAAGVAAAVITLGISGAIIAGGRSKPRDDRLARDAAADESLTDGERALGELPLTLPDGTPLPSFGSGARSARTGSGSGTTGASTTTGLSDSTGAERSRSLPTGSGTSTTPSSSPSTTTPPTTAPPKAPTSPSSPSSPTSPTSPTPTIPPLIGDESDEPAPTDPVTEPLAPVVEAVEETVVDVVGSLDPLLGGGGTDTTTGGLLG